MKDDSAQKMSWLFDFLVSPAGRHLAIGGPEDYAHLKPDITPHLNELLNLADHIDQVIKQYQGGSMGPFDLLEGELPQHFENILGLSIAEETNASDSINASEILHCSFEEITEIYGFTLDHEIEWAEQPPPDEYMLWVLRDLRDEAQQRFDELSGTTRTKVTEMSNYYDSGYPKSRSNFTNEL